MRVATSASSDLAHGLQFANHCHRQGEWEREWRRQRLTVRSKMCSAFFSLFCFLPFLPFSSSLQILSHFTSPAHTAFPCLTTHSSFSLSCTALLWLFVCKSTILGYSRRSLGRGQLHHRTKQILYTT